MNDFESDHASGSYLWEFTPASPRRSAAWPVAVALAVIFLAAVVLAMII